MYFKSKKTSLLILALTSLVFSRALFFFFNDPEGPNLLIVSVLAALIYCASLAAYSLNSLAAGPKKLFLTILIQILMVAALYLCLN